MGKVAQEDQPTRKPTQRTGKESLERSKMMLKIETAGNGWIVRNKWNEKDESETEAVVVIPSTDDNVTGYINLLQEIAEMLCLYGDRYDKWRIKITKRKGDKHEDGKDVTCAEQNPQN